MALRQFKWTPQLPNNFFYIPKSLTKVFIYCARNLDADWQTIPNLHIFDTPCPIILSDWPEFLMDFSVHTSVFQNGPNETRRRNLLHNQLFA